MAEIVSKLVDAIIGQARYLFCFNRYVRNFESQKENLQSKIEMVVDRAKEVEKKTEKVASDVDEWLKRADSLIEHVVELEEKAKKRNKTTCLKCFSNWIKRYSLAKQLEEKTNEIIECNKIELTKFYRLMSLVGMNYITSKGFVHFDSRKVPYDGLLEALKDNEINMIGLYGLGGCGKTTLIKEVGKEVKKIFDKVVFVVVSNTIDVQKIQEGIASQLGLKLEEKDEQGRARRLFMGLSIGKRFLLILDDVWEELDFEAIGIPKDERQKGCIVLITTRYRSVCTLMKCQVKIPLHVLNETEALTLFQKHAEILDDNFDNLKDLAQNIAKECGGLPFAIVATANTLKGKCRSDWEEALKTLRDSSWVDIEEGMRNPNRIIQLSYDDLNNVVAESLFLLCSVFPEDYKISVEDLTMFGIGLGLAGEVDSHKRARNRISSAKDKLIDSCLLQEDKGDKFIDEEMNFVKMHDLVRDVAISIAKKKNELIIGPERSQKALQENMIMKDDKVIYLWLGHDEDEFPNQLDCPELQFLHMSVRLQSEGAKDDCFKRMKKLKVLVLKNIGMCVKLPKSIHLINNIRCLILSGWSLGDISFIGSLEKLESLSLRDCSLDELPNSIVQQKDLRYLCLRDCEIQKNPYEVIGRCSQLEELYFHDNRGKNWEDQGENVAEFFDKNNATPVLERYVITTGQSNYLRKQKNMIRCLFVEYFDTCISNATIMNLLQRAQALGLKRIHRCKNVIPEVAQTIGRDMNDLTELSLYDSSEIECVIDTSHPMCNVGIMSNLTHLTIRGIKGLKTVCHGHPPQGLFAKLEVLEISSCDSFEHIMMDEVKEIFADDSEYQSSHGSVFSKLKELIIQECNQLEQLFPASFADCFIQLESLKIDGAAKLKSVFGSFNNGSTFSKLKELDIRGCNQLEHLFPASFADWSIQLESLKIDGVNKLKSVFGPFNNGSTFSRLKELDIQGCSQLEGDMNELTDLSLYDSNEIECLIDTSHPMCNAGIMFNLTHLTIRRIKSLKTLCHGQPPQGLFANLKVLEISSCDSFEHIIMDEVKEIVADDSEHQISHGSTLSKLKELIIQECNQLEQLFPASFADCSIQLESLKIDGAHNLKSIFGSFNNGSAFSELKELDIRGCNQLEHVFPASFAHCFTQLKSLKLSHNDKLKSVIGLQ